MELNRSIKIGILSYPLNNNYGCYMQSYALLSYLRNNGYDAEYIYRRRNKPTFLSYIKYSIVVLLQNIKSFSWKSIRMDYEKEYMLRKGTLLYPFFKEKINPHTQPIYTSRRLKKVCSQYDVIIVGSDQVWRAEILPNIEDYFLSFLGDSEIKRIAYAASFGKEKPGYKEIQKRRCGEAIGKFSAISVREIVGKKIIKDFGWPVTSCEVVVDPTMLLDRKDYQSLISGIDLNESVFGYILDQKPEKLEMLTYLADYYNLSSINFLEGSDLDEFIYPPVEEWLSRIAHSKFIITDSFHGVVFSIIFNIPFAVVINRDRGTARFETVLKTFELQDRAVNSIADLKTVVKRPINWNRVNCILNDKKNDAECFLKMSLSGIQK